MYFGIMGLEYHVHRWVRNGFSKRSWLAFPGYAPVVLNKWAERWACLESLQTEHRFCGRDMQDSSGRNFFSIEHVAFFQYQADKAT